MIEFSLHLATIYLICAPERGLVWWAVLGLVLLTHAGLTLAWFRRETRTHGCPTTPPAKAREALTHMVDQGKPLRV